MAEDVLIYVDNISGNNNNDGTQRRPVATADEAFSRLPCCWHGRAEINFNATNIPYPVTTSVVYFGTPIGPDASPLVIRGGYAVYPEFGIVPATADSAGNFIETRFGRTVDADQLIGAVLTRRSGTGSPVGTAISIRGNSVSPTTPDILKIFLQRTIGQIKALERFTVQRPAVTLVPTQTLNLTSHDGQSPNLTLIGIKIAPAPGAGLTLLNLRARCDTCEFSFERDTTLSARVTCYVHTDSRIQGGIEGERAQAGAYIHSDNASNFIWAVRGGVLGGHLTFRSITVRVSQGGSFVPTSLEALEAPVHILAGGAALAEAGGWGTANNKARIRNVAVPEGEGDGLRVFNGGALSSPADPINLDIFGCNRDGIRLDAGSSASFGPPGGPPSRPPAGLTGLVTTGTDLDTTGIEPNGGWGMNVRNGSRSLVGADATATRPRPLAPTPLIGGSGRQVALDDGDAGRRGRSFSWGDVVTGPQSNERLSLVSTNA